MTALTAWHDLVVPEIRGVTPEASLYEIRRIAIEFCEQSQAIDTQLAAINVVASQSTYTLTPPADTMIVDVHRVEYNGKVLTPSSQADLDRAFDKWRTETGVPKYWYLETRTTLRLAKTPADTLTAGLVVTVATKPTDTAATVDDRLWTDHAESIKIGTLGRLLMMDGKPWSNPQKAALYQSQFVSRINAAAVHRDGLTRRIPLRTRVHR